MIQHNPEKSQRFPWQKLLAEGLSNVHDLIAILKLDLNNPLAAQVMEQTFPLRVPRGFVAKMKPGDWADPLLVQILPQSAETHVYSGYTVDPLDEKKANRLPGLLHKYANRVLLMLSTACAVHCRYCFRRDFPYSSNHLTAETFQAILSYIKANPTIHEVILSGGDPLLLTDQRLRSYLTAIGTLHQIKRLRVHTRLPIVLPERVTDPFIECLSGFPWQTVVVLHCNHPKELDHKLRLAVDRMKQAGFYLLNQSVLLKGVNDHADTLVALSEALFDHGILPYYIHQLDPVQGTGHFEVPLSEAKALMRQISARLSGYLLPKWVKECSGLPHKLLLNAWEP